MISIQKREGGIKVQNLEKIYMDYAATTPMRPEVLEAMEPFFCEKFGNPSARYSWGREARQAVEKARGQVAALIHAEPDEIYFTSGGSEADNWAIRMGCEQARRSRKNSREEFKIATLPIEHHAVLNACMAEKARGTKIELLPIYPDGATTAYYPDAFLKNVGMMSVMLANNETGAIQPVEELALIAKEHGVLFHSDAVQAVGNIPVSVETLKADLLSMSAHKFYGPKGVGALYIRRGTILPALILGGHQERDHRAGTENVPGIVGMGKAAELAKKEIPDETFRKSRMRNYMRKMIEETIPEAHCNSTNVYTLPGTLNFSFAGVESEALVMMMDSLGVACSGGSACTSMDLEPSHVLKAMDVDEKWLHGSVRFSFGRETGKAQVDEVVKRLGVAVQRLREMNPLWEGGANG